MDNKKTCLQKTDISSVCYDQLQPIFQRAASNSVVQENSVMLPRYDPILQKKETNLLHSGEQKGQETSEDAIDNRP